MEQEWQRGDSRSEVRVGPSMQKERWNSTELTQQSTRNGAHQQQLWRRRQRVGSGGDEGDSVVGFAVEQFQIYEEVGRRAGGVKAR